MADTGDAAQLLFARIGEFLAGHRLSTDPANYAFAYRVISEPDGALARAVAALTDGGVRLTRQDIESLGSNAGAPDSASPTAAASGDGLVAQTQMQVEGFEDMMRAMRVETEDFGRDLAASADAIRDSGETVEVEKVIHITGTMLDRVQIAESRLEVATHEASELREKLEEARANARLDPLTDLPNRRAFEESFETAAGSGEKLCIAICDIDRFKTVNDNFGHAVGDRVLKAIGAVLAQSCTGHLVARYGGEEFALLFSGIDLEQARAKLESARAIVATKRYRVLESDEPLREITFSAGLTAAGPHEGFADIFVRADRLLYAAKADGRNCLKTG